MGRTLPTITETFHQFQKDLSLFRRALRRTDQAALDDLLVSVQKHLPAANYAACPLPEETFLIAMLLEEHKQVLRLREQVERLYSEHNQRSEPGRDG